MSKHDKRMLGVVEVFTFYFTFAAQVVVITNAVKKYDANIIVVIE